MEVLQNVPACKSDTDFGSWKTFEESLQRSVPRKMQTKKGALAFHYKFCVVRLPVDLTWSLPTCRPDMESCSLGEVAKSLWMPAPKNKIQQRRSTDVSP